MADDRPARGLRESLGFADGDAAYQMMVDLIADLDDRQATLAMAKCLLLLANHIGDEAVLGAAIDQARAGIAPKNTPKNTSGNTP